jgi:hypothetical protein
MSETESGTAVGYSETDSSTGHSTIRLQLTVWEQLL